MSRLMKIVSLVLFCVSLIAVPSLWANWVQDGVALCTATRQQQFPAIASDGAGGAIITWYDFRSGNSDIYAQRVNASGAVQWTADGVPLCTATWSQGPPTIISDGAGGAIVTWEDTRGNNYDIYAQRVSASGSLQWTADGVPLCTATGNQLSPMITPDDAEGAIVTWYDSRNGYYDIYAQRVNASGVVQWTGDGVPLCMATGDQYSPKITYDGWGGAIIMWYDFRSGNSDIYAQRMSASGVVQWTADGVPLCTATGQQQFPAIASDGAGGAITTWYDTRIGDSDIYAQRVNASGAVQWTADGVPLCTATGNQYKPTITSDDAGGAIITWYDTRIGDSDIYAQRVNVSGVVQWTADGVPLCTATGTQYSPTVTFDGAGGAIITWYDSRSGNSDIYAQRVNASGVVQWTGDGVPLCAATGDQFSPKITSDGWGGAIVTWEDYPDGVNSDIYAQRVDANGFSVLTGTDEPIVHGELHQNYPNPFNPTTRIAFELSAPVHVSLRIYDTTGRLVRELINDERLTGRCEENWDGRDSRERAVASGIYFYRFDAGSFTQTKKMVLLR
ncbi:MAG: T9SS type A sorting domain-containing protein [Candidatus Krumholzibacteria bacterium]|nr:T9SS type A sorting domain-containing protein [Candidatus Krumholzibacteria bacterium]